MAPPDLCWSVDAVVSLVTDQDEDLAFCCGGCRNAASLLHLFDAVFVLDVDLETLHRRLTERPEDEWAGRGRHVERDLVLRLHQTRQDLPSGIRINATRPMSFVVDDISATAGDRNGERRQLHPEAPALSHHQRRRR